MTSPLNQEIMQPYSELLRRQFARPAHAGDLPKSKAGAYIARRDESDQGAAVEIAALVGRAAVGKGVPGIERFVGKIEGDIAVVAARAAAGDDFGLPTGLADGLGGEGILIDPDFLDLVAVR